MTTPNPFSSHLYTAKRFNADILSKLESFSCLEDVRIYLVENLQNVRQPYGFQPYGFYPRGDNVFSRIKNYGDHRLLKAIFDAVPEMFIYGQVVRNQNALSICCTDDLCHLLDEWALSSKTEKLLNVITMFLIENIDSKNLNEPLFSVIDCQHWPCVDLLINYGVSGSDCCYESLAKQGELARFKALFKNNKRLNAEISASDKKYYPCFDCIFPAVRSGNTDLVWFITDHFYLFNEPSLSHISTAIAIAADEMSLGMINALSASRIGSIGRETATTVLRRTVESHSEYVSNKTEKFRADFTEIVLFLLSKEADIYSKTCLLPAIVDPAVCKDEGVLQMLLNYQGSHTKRA